LQLPGDLQYKERDSIDPMLDDLLEATIQLLINTVNQTVCFYIFLLFHMPSIVASNQNSLDCLQVEDLYATILYNDEVHTYEEVISTLQKAVLCDRNGRHFGL
jgi:ATP-dependent Clp protease adaptor protein ClpS